MKLTLPIFVLSFLLLLSCVSTEQKHSESESLATAVEKLPPFFEVECDKKKVVLRDKTFSKPLFVIIAQKKCPPCEILYRHALKLKQRFGDRFDLVVIYNDNRIRPIEGLDVCLLTKDTRHLVTPTQQFPRAVFFDDNGNVVVDISGVYPQMYYYGVLREILTNQRLRSLSEQSPQE